MAIKDLSGKRYGKLTCVEPAGERGADGCMLWRCRCDCGGECLATVAQLDRGERKSCGCMQRKPQSVSDGQRFGRLVVTGYAGIRDRRRSWYCRCDCGTECVVSGTALRQGKKKSCGCLRPRGQADLTGVRFGSLLVTGYAGKRDGRYYWRCRCDCGNTAEIRQSNLLAGHTKSCGCLQRESSKNNLKLIGGTSVALIESRLKTPISSNTSGYNGVYRDKRRGKWCAQITFMGKTYYLGSFSDIQDAIEARRKGEEKYYDGFLAWYYGERNASALSASGASAAESYGH